MRIVRCQLSLSLSTKFSFEPKKENEKGKNFIYLYFVRGSSLVKYAKFLTFALISFAGV